MRLITEGKPDQSLLSFLNEEDIAQQLRDAILEDTSELRQGITEVLVLIAKDRDKYASLTRELVDALIWASGAPEFAPGGQHHDAWVKTGRPALEAGLEALKGEEG